jgi:hypothetical protein
MGASEVALIHEWILHAILSKSKGSKRIIFKITPRRLAGESLAMFLEVET